METEVNRIQRKRPRIAFFDYPDVFEDFYSHYGVDQQTFSARWANTSNHAFLSLIQREIGDVIWYIFSLTPKIKEAQHETVGCRIKFFSSSWLHRRLWSMFYLPRMAWRWRGAYNFYATLASYLAPLSLPFLKTLWRDQPDIIFVQDYASGRFDVLILLAKILKIPLIAYHTGSLLEEHQAQKIRRFTIRQASCLIASSYNELKLVAEKYQVRQDRLRVILTPIDTSVYRELDRNFACREVALNSERRYILFVGRFDDVIKRVSAIIRAFSNLANRFENVDLLIIGTGNDEKKLRELALELTAPERIQFLGWIAEAETKAQYYNVAECLVLASWREGFPTVVGEAMACGTPVLSSRVGGVSELVTENRTGWLFAPGDDTALKNHLDFVLSNPEISAKMRPQARNAAVSRVSVSAVSSALRECFLIKTDEI